MWHIDNPNAAKNGTTYSNNGGRHRRRRRRTKPEKLCRTHIVIDVIVYQRREQLRRPRHLQTRVLTVAKAASGREFLHRSFPAAYSRINGHRVANLDEVEPTRLEGTGPRLVASGAFDFCAGSSIAFRGNKPGLPALYKRIKRAGLSGGKNDFTSHAQSTSFGSAVLDPGGRSPRSR